MAWRISVALPAALAKKDSELDDAVDKKAEPEIDESAPINQSPMPGAGRKVWRQGEIDRITGDHSDQIFDPAAGSGGHDCPGYTFDRVTLRLPRSPMALDRAGIDLDCILLQNRECTM